MRWGRGALIVAVAAGCASGPRATDAPRTSPKGGPHSERALPIPADLASHVEESARLGRLIYLLDKASATGSDALRAKVPDVASRGLGHGDGQGQAIDGWLTLEDPAAGGAAPGCSVLFYTNEGQPRLAFQVTVPAAGEPSVEAISPPTPLDRELFRLVRARQVALAVVPRGARPFNPVIVPLSTPGRPDAILVYLLAAEREAGEMVFGVHYRVLVSADGTSAGNKVEQIVPLTKSALVVREPRAEEIPPGDQLVATVVSHVVTDWPLETHVFVSLLHKNAPIYVATRRGTWLVIGDKITLVDDKSLAPRWLTRRGMR